MRKEDQNNFCIFTTAYSVAVSDYPRGGADGKRAF